MTASGRELAADMVVMGTGAMPDVMLARAAGLELGETRRRGLLRRPGDLRAPGIWAAGDMCEYDSVLHGGRVRIEHFEVARAQGAAAAAAMLGTRRPYAELPYFWTDLSDWAPPSGSGPPSRRSARSCAARSQRRRLQRAAARGRPARRARCRSGAARTWHTRAA